ncbi:hypothetical protein BKA70DRAFT_609055 [Coprinopsis sp. MPI-PUGE-AT-0042]|nr:hypothetical protein BKA70DRAFT_609055 [Coprinopsis sp. MPI-PUGE-AT-0042]
MSIRLNSHWLWSEVAYRPAIPHYVRLTRNRTAVLRHCLRPPPGNPRLGYFSCRCAMGSQRTAQDLYTSFLGEPSEQRTREMICNVLKHAHMGRSCMVSRNDACSRPSTRLPPSLISFNPPSSHLWPLLRAQDHHLSFNETRSLWQRKLGRPASLRRNTHAYTVHNPPSSSAGDPSSNERGMQRIEAEAALSTRQKPTGRLQKG